MVGNIESTERFRKASTVDRCAVEESEKHVLTPYVRVGVQDGRLFLGSGSIQRVFSTTSVWEPLIRLVGYYSIPRTLAEARTPGRRMRIFFSTFPGARIDPLQRPLPHSRRLLSPGRQV